MGEAMGGQKGKRRAPLSTAVGPLADTAPSWEELQAMLERRKAETGWTDERADPEAGPETQPHSLRRTFGKLAPGQEPRVKLYRDHAAWCPYSQKVWLFCEAKQIPYVLEKINMRCYGPKPASYTAKVPSGLLPAVELDGELITESDRIMFVLEAEFPDRPMLPPRESSEARDAARLLQLERRLFGAWLQWLTSGWGHAQGKAAYEDVIGEVERRLKASGPGPFFLPGDSPSLVDCSFAPFLERMNASLFYYKGFRLRGPEAGRGGKYPHLERWFEAMEATPWYFGTKSDFYTHAHDLPPQLGGCAPAPGSEPCAAAIDGTDGVSWTLPLPPLSSSPEAGWVDGGDKDPVEAAHRVLANHGPIARFSARANGPGGTQRYGARLSDPTAKADPTFSNSDGTHEEIADGMLRRTVHALLDREGAEAMQAQHALDPATAASAASAAAYLRDRVGVPRDMKYPAARQLRAHLNHTIEGL